MYKRQVLDRVIQQAIAQVLSPVYEPTFSDNSYGFRPGRRARQAIEEMQKEGNKRRPKCHVVDCDLQQFFDTVDHRKLMERLRESVREHRLMGLIAKFLKAGVRPDQSPVRRASRRETSVRFMVTFMSNSALFLRITFTPIFSGSFKRD